MNTITILSSADLYTYLKDHYPTLRDEYVDAVVDQIQFSDHPEWGANWSAWLAEETDRLVEEVVDGLDAMGES